MIHFTDGGCLVERTDELPRLTHAKRLYLDCETQSFDPQTKALDSWAGHRIAGVAVTVDDESTVWYVPVRHTNSQRNLPHAIEWLRETIETCETWCNHNIKFDAHFAAREGIDIRCALHCTLAAAKVLKSDRYNYALDQLSKEWFGLDTEYVKQTKAYLQSTQSKNYGDVPPDILGEYACEDVRRARTLDRFVDANLSEQCRPTLELERKLTPVLFDIEERGMKIDVAACEIEQLVTMKTLLLIEEELHRLVGYPLNPESNDDCFDVLCNKFDLPILARTDNGNASFDAATMKDYSYRPETMIDKKLARIVNLILQHRKSQTLLSLFLIPYLELNVDGILHPDYNQIINTGRMSCRRPNAQQLSKRAKEFVIPRGAFSRWDYSQIEFRIIVHYIKNVAAIAAYNENPHTDFHVWVAEMCGIDRDPAKNVNFAIGFGASRNRVLKMLAANPKLVEDLIEQIQDEQPARRAQLLRAACRQRAETVYDRYHAELPELRRTAYQAGRIVEQYGYVFTARGRRRHLPRKQSHKAFSSVIQGSAADVVKERLVALAPRYNSRTRELDLHPVAVVHDEILIEDPSDSTLNPEVVAWITNLLESSDVEFRVPLRVQHSRSTQSWAEAS